MNQSEFAAMIGNRYISRRPLNGDPVESCGYDRLFNTIWEIEPDPAAVMQRFCNTGEYESPHCTYTLHNRPSQTEAQQSLQLGGPND